jgi:transcriptional regulator with XRE-family HTH domain
MQWGYYMQTVGNRVKSLRISKRLNQQQLADRIGTTQSAIAKIERGQTKKMEGETLEALARELSSTPSYILYGAQNSEDHEHSMIAAEMAAIFRDLTISDKETILRMARGILPTKKNTAGIK